MLLGGGSFALAQPTVNADAPQASFNIAKYGAKANDPNFDNGPIISQLIDKLPATGGVIKIPAGTYYIKTPIKVNKSFVTIQGVNDGWRSGVDPANSNSKESGGSHIELANQNMDAIDVHSADSHRLSGDEFRDFNIEGQSSTGVGINVQSDNDHIVVQGMSMKNLGTDLINKGADCTRVVNNQFAESRNNIALTGASQQVEIGHNQLGAQPGGISVEMENPSNYAVNSNLIYPDGSSNITLYNPSHGTVWGNTLSSYTTGLINVLPNAQGNKGNANVIASNQLTINAYHKNGYATNNLHNSLTWGAIHDENFRDLINHNNIEMNTPSGTAGIVMNSSQGTRAQDNIVTDNNVAAVNNTVPQPAAPTVSADAGDSTSSPNAAKPAQSSPVVKPVTKPSATTGTLTVKPTTNGSTGKPQASSAPAAQPAVKPTVSSSTVKPSQGNSSSESTSTTQSSTKPSSADGNVIPPNPAANSSTKPTTNNSKPAATTTPAKPATTTSSSINPSSVSSSSKPTSLGDGTNSSQSNDQSGSAIAPTGSGNTIPVNTDSPAAKPSGSTSSSKPATSESDGDNKPAANSGSTSNSAENSAPTSNSSSSATNSSSASSNEPSAIPVTGGSSTNDSGSSTLPIGGGTTATTDHVTPSDTPVVQPSDDETPSQGSPANSSSGEPSSVTDNSGSTEGTTSTPTDSSSAASSITDGNTIPDNPLGGGTTATTASVKPTTDPNGVIDTGSMVTASSSGKKNQAKTSSTESNLKSTVKSSSIEASVDKANAKSAQSSLVKDAYMHKKSSLTPAEKDRSFLMSQVEAGNRNKDRDAMMSKGSSSMESSSSRSSVKTTKKHSHESSMMNQQSSSLVANNSGANANAAANGNGTPAFAQTGGTTKMSHNWLYNLIYGLFNKK